MEQVKEGNAQEGAIRPTGLGMAVGVEAIIREFELASMDSDQRGRQEVTKSLSQLIKRGPIDRKYQLFREELHIADVKLIKIEELQYDVQKHLEIGLERLMESDAGVQRTVEGLMDCRALIKTRLRKGRDGGARLLAGTRQLQRDYARAFEATQDYRGALHRHLYLDRGEELKRLLAEMEMELDQEELDDRMLARYGINLGEGGAVPGASDTSNGVRGPAEGLETIHEEASMDGDAE